MPKSFKQKRLHWASVVRELEGSAWCSRKETHFNPRLFMLLCQRKLNACAPNAELQKFTSNNFQAQCIRYSNKERQRWVKTTKKLSILNSEHCAKRTWNYLSSTISLTKHLSSLLDYKTKGVKIIVNYDIKLRKIRRHTMG